MTNTYKPIFRSILSSRQFRNAYCFKVWMWCLLKSTDQPYDAMVGRQEIRVEPGQFVFGRQEAARELNMSESTVWYWMKFLQKDGSLDIKSNNKFSIISLSNYQDYRDILDSTYNNKKTTKRQQKDTYKEVKEQSKEDISIDISHEPQPAADRDPNDVFALYQYVAEHQGAKPFPDKGRQLKAAKSILSESGYTLEEAKAAVDRMHDDSYWGSRIFDVVTLTRHIARYSRQQETTFINLDALRAERTKP